MTPFNGVISVIKFQETKGLAVINLWSNSTYQQILFTEARLMSHSHNAHNYVYISLTLVNKKNKPKDAAPILHGVFGQ